MEEKTIAMFLDVLEKFKTRLEKAKSFHDAKKNAYQYLWDKANAFEGVDAAAYVDELFALLTVENSERLKTKIGEILLRYSGDTRKALLDASDLVLESEEVRYTKEWVNKAEKVLTALVRIRMLDDLSSALKLFEGRDDDFVLKARKLVDPDTNTGGKWYANAKEALKVLQRNKPKDVQAEAAWFCDRIKLELKGREKDNRSVFWEAKQFLGRFEASPEWLKDAETQLLAVREEIVSIDAKKTLGWWMKNLPSDVKQEPIEALKKALDERDLSAVNRALESLKGFKPTCTEEGCKNHLSRKDNGRGEYFDKCKDHRPPVQTVASLSAPATEDKLQQLKAVLEEGAELQGIPDVPLIQKETRNRKAQMGRKSKKK